MIGRAELGPGYWMLGGPSPLVVRSPDGDVFYRLDAFETFSMDYGEVYAEPVYVDAQVRIPGSGYVVDGVSTCSFIKELEG